MTRLLCAVLSVLCFGMSPVVGQVYQQRGTVVGGLAGAAAGAAIGEHNDNPLAGALIGGAVGLVTGSALGNARDHEAAQARAWHQAQQQTLARRVSPQDVVAMTHNGLGDAVIINHIRANGVQRQLQVADVIALHQQGVSEPVISALQSGTSGGVRQAPSVRVYQPIPRPPVVVEHYVAPQFHFGGHRGYRGRRHYRHRRGPGFHFSFGR